MICNNGFSQAVVPTKRIINKQLGKTQKLKILAPGLKIKPGV